MALCIHLSISFISGAYNLSYFTKKINNNNIDKQFFKRSLNIISINFKYFLDELRNQHNILLIWQQNGRVHKTSIYLLDIYSFHIGKYKLNTKLYLTKRAKDLLSSNHYYSSKMIHTVIMKSKCTVIFPHSHNEKVFHTITKLIVTFKIFCKSTILYS